MVSILKSCGRRDPASIPPTVGRFGQLPVRGHRYLIKASRVFFTALGRVGDRGAFFLTSIISAPSSCSFLRPKPSRTFGNQSCSFSSIW